MAFAGHMNVELIQSDNGAPSVYRELIERRGYGFHHWGRATSQFDRDVEQYRAPGHKIGFICRVPNGGRVASTDTTQQRPGFVELVELGGAFEPVFSRFYRASVGGMARTRFARLSEGWRARYPRHRSWRYHWYESSP